MRFCIWNRLTHSQYLWCLAWLVKLKTAKQLIISIVLVWILLNGLVRSIKSLRPTDHKEKSGDFPEESQDSVFLWDFLKNIQTQDVIIKTPETSSQKGAMEISQKQNNCKLADLNVEGNIAFLSDYFCCCKSVWIQGQIIAVLLCFCKWNAVVIMPSQFRTILHMILSGNLCLCSNFIMIKNINVYF